MRQISHTSIIWKQMIVLNGHTLKPLNARHDSKIDWSQHNKTSPSFIEHVQNKVVTKSSRLITKITLKNAKSAAFCCQLVCIYKTSTSGTFQTKTQFDPQSKHPNVPHSSYTLVSPALAKRRLFCASTKQIKKLILQFPLKLWRDANVCWPVQSKIGEKNGT